MNWIKCSDRLPRYNKEVLIYHEITSGWVIDIAYFSAGQWISTVDGWSAWQPTHWMELPDAPNMEV